MGKVTGKSFSFCAFLSEVGTAGDTQLTRELGVNIALNLVGMYSEHMCWHSWLVLTLLKSLA